MDEIKVDFHKILMGIDSEVDTLDGIKVRGVNFDNAATTPPLKSVVDSIINLSSYYGSIGRGAGHKAEITTRIYNESRDHLMNFFNIKEKSKYTVIYVNNATDGINKLARTLINNKDEVVISTRMEHHSNDLPWRKQCTVDHIEVDEVGRLKIDELEEKLINYRGRVKYVTVTGASNVTGYINDIHKIARIVHKYNAKIIVDGAQLVPHVKVNMWGYSPEERIDFLVFSAHKLYAPFGAGAIIGLKEDFDNSLPPNEGGGTVNFVMDKDVEYLLAPERDEAGTPNFFGAVSISKALDELNKIGFDKLHKKEIYLRERLMNGLKSIPSIINYGDINYRWDRLGIGVFNLSFMYHQTVAEILAKSYGISVRQGWFCAHPYCRRLMRISEKDASAFIHDKTKRMPGMIRVSFGMYNNEDEVDYFLDAIESIALKNKYTGFKL
ncbi:aminotransferase class V-fold PLP-dependent enzyme [Clostridium paraputrificum]|uniref:aminotransferase class V-fold PLP-dependent enzyme n=1 Tax=Clostridium TaxID=1485 RepID=UPI003D337C4C